MAYENNSIFWVEVAKVVPNPFQPRREFDESKLTELAESIRMYGVLQPLVVTRREVPLDDGAFRSEYELIAGERRLRASKLAGLEQVPVIIRSGEETELMKLELAIIENLQREDLNPVDRALAFRQLADKFGLSHAQVGKKVGRSREYVSNSIRLLQLPDTILGALKTGDISDGHARTLLMLNDRPEEQDVIFREILLKKLSVREVERITRKIATDKIRKKNWQDSDPELIAIERQFTETLGTRVQITKTDYGGRLMIDYFSQEDLNKLFDMLKEQEATMPTAAMTVAQLAASTPLESADESTAEENTAADSESEAEAVQPEDRVEGSTDIPHTESESSVTPETTETSEVVSAPETVAEVESESLYKEQQPTYGAPIESEEAMEQPFESESESELETVADKQSPEEPEPADEVVSPKESFYPHQSSIQSRPQHQQRQQTPEPTAEQQPEPEDELYSIKNFSL